MLFSIQAQVSLMLSETHVSQIRVIEDRQYRPLEVKESSACAAQTEAAWRRLLQEVLKIHP